MKGKTIRVTLFVGVFLSVLVALVMAAQDRYTVKVPNGLAFSDFRTNEWDRRRQSRSAIQLRRDLDISLAEMDPLTNVHQAQAAAARRANLEPLSVVFDG